MNPGHFEISKTYFNPLILEQVSVKKTNYGFYGDGGPPDGTGGGDVFAEEQVEAHEMGQVKTVTNGTTQHQQQEEMTYQEEEEVLAPEEAAPASNPFKSKAASNPFGQYKE